MAPTDKLVGAEVTVVRFLEGVCLEGLQVACVDRGAGCVGIVLQGIDLFIQLNLWHASSAAQLLIEQMPIAWVKR